MQKIKELLIVYTIGFVGYSCIELLWRNFTHPSMSIAGGICFLSFHILNRRMNKLSSVKKCFLGAVIITSVEFFFGCIVNIALNMHIWDYSALPLNLLGQICLPYFIVWFVITIPMLAVSNLIVYCFKTKSITAHT